MSGRKARLPSLLMQEKGFAKGEAFSLSVSVNGANSLALSIMRVGTREVPASSSTMILDKTQSRQLRDFLNDEVNF